MKDIVALKSTSVFSLDGEWMLSIDPENRGKNESWFSGIQLHAKPARVPWIIQDTYPEYHGLAWYWKKFHVAENPHINGRYLLRFNAVDYIAQVWVNGIFVGEHEGSETPFTLDITEAVNPESDNLLAVRVLNPTTEPIDGVVLAKTPHRNKAVPFNAGSSYNIGGIMESVELLITPAVYFTDLYVKPDPETGVICIQATIFNACGVDTDCAVKFTVALSSGGETKDVIIKSYSAPVGESVVQSELTVIDWQLWDLNSPVLYRVTATVCCGSDMDEKSVRCGFRDFRVENGFFRLNGKRIFLKSTHTGNHCPVGGIIPLPGRPDVLIQDLMYAKIMGFNMVRFISAAAHPYQLDFCDEIGLMVYEESYAAWCLEDSPDMKRRMDLSNREMIIRDRNHPSVSIWGMLNENLNNPTYQHARDSLGLVRSLDDSRLVLLGSGRWDCEWSVGSVSNPGSDKWEYVWGDEGPGVEDSKWADWAGGCMQGAGDIHVYPGVPHTQAVENNIRSLGKDSKPVFVSEYGIGSTMNVIREWRKCQEAGVNQNAEDVALLRKWSESYLEDWHKYGFDGVYPFPEDMMRHSQQLMARWRAYGFDLIRSNPRICGFNLTGMLDHGMTGEGVWTFWREFKPGVVDAMADGWASLRWCMFASPMHGYSDRPFKFNIVLANEDVLAPGDYPVCAKVFGKDGVVWEHRTSIHIDKPQNGIDGPLAVPVLLEEVVLDVSAGEYELAVNMESGAAPAGGRLTFYVSDPDDLPEISKNVALWGVDDGTRKWLESRGINCSDFSNSTDQNAVILVGDSEELMEDEQGWDHLYEAVRNGQNVVFASSAAFRRKNGEEIDPVGWLPFENKGRCWEFPDWLYHKECVAKPHAVFAGLPGRGIMNWEYYGSVISSTIFTDQDTPDDIAVASFAAGHSCDGYRSGIMLCSYPLGNGRMIMNTFRIMENLGVNPAADRLLLNLLNYAAAK